jgi:hypothetical protein
MDPSDYIDSPTRVIYKMDFDLVSLAVRLKSMAYLLNHVHDHRNRDECPTDKNSSTRHHSKPVSSMASAWTRKVQSGQHDGVITEWLGCFQMER